MFSILLCQPIQGIQFLNKNPNNKVENPEVKKKFTRAKSLEKAGLWADAEVLYREINTEEPGNKRYFSPLKNILKQREEWDTLIQYSINHKNANQNDIRGIIDLAEVYIWAGKISESNRIINNVLDNKSVNLNLVKMIINKLAQNLRFDQADSLVRKVRLERDDPAFYSLEMGRYYANRMVYDKSLSEYIIYLEQNPTRLDFVSDKILSFLDTPEITKMIINKLKKTSFIESKIILSNIHFKNKEYKKAYKQLKNNKIETRYILDFCSDLTMNAEYNLAEEVVSNILKSKKTDSNIMEKAIFNLAYIFEKKTIQNIDPLPISGFFKNNSFLSSEFMKVDENHIDPLWKAINIYDSLLTVTESSEANYRLAEIRYRILGDLDGAVKNYKNIINKKGNGKFVKESIFRLIDIALSKGDLKKAFNLLDEYQNDYRLKKVKTEFDLKYAKILFYDGNLDSLNSHIKHSFSELPFDDPMFNDLLEIRTFLVHFENEKDLFSIFSNAQLLIHKNKRQEAVEKLKQILLSDNEAINDMIRYQISYILVLQEKHLESLEIIKEVTGESIFTELSIVLRGEIFDFLLNDSESAIDNYLEFLENYPSSVYYDKVRMRLREIAS